MTDQTMIADAEIVEDPATPPDEDTAREVSRALAAPARQAALAVTPAVEATELVHRLAVIREAADKAMEKDVDYGVIPGTDKPTLYKPGAEKLGVLFQLDIQLENKKTWNGDHLTVESTATVYHAPTGARLGFGEGLCSTREKKYAKRRAQRICPDCGQAAVIKGKAEYGGGWLCFRKKDGCGAKWPDGDPVIESQEVGEVDNPDLPDTWNTVVKMAEKRARVDAVLAVTGASALFTQDIEDQAPDQEPPQAARQAPADDRDPMDTIDPAWAESLLDLFRSKGLTQGDIKGHLHAVGITQAMGLHKQGIQNAVARLSPAQATTLEQRVNP